VNHSKEYIAGFAAAVHNLGVEGDFRRVDWSGPHGHLKTVLSGLEETKSQEIAGMKIVFSAALERDVIEFHHADGRIDTMRLQPAPVVLRVNETD
jgi:hypothetical protein